MRILYINTSDIGGGAFRQAADLRNNLIELGHDVMLACRTKKTNDDSVYIFNNDANRHPWARLMLRLFGYDPSTDLGEHDPARARKKRISIALGQPLRTWRVYNGYEDFDFPGTHSVLDRCPRKPDLIHLWNLHGGYFDLRILPELSRHVPVVIDLQDNWSFTGHCAYFRDCDRWQNGCTPCKYLHSAPALRVDRAGANWSTKRDIYSRSRYWVKAPCKWTYDRIPRSILATGMQGIRLITNSIETKTFNVGDRATVRAKLGLPADAIILLYTAQSIEGTFYKDFPTLKAAIELIAKSEWPRKILFMTIGGLERKQGSIGNIETVGLPWVSSREDLADYYRAADLFLHAGIEEVWGLTMTEAMACGTPVIASAVGGIPEQVWHERNGLLVPPQDPRLFADAIERLLRDDALRARLGRDAAVIARDNFGARLAAERHAAYYADILAGRATQSGTP
jgi:glycosyltransferase involved in cell wall biosynthesis